MVSGACVYPVVALRGSLRWTDMLLLLWRDGEIGKGGTFRLSFLRFTTTDDDEPAFLLTMYYTIILAMSGNISIVLSSI